MTGERTFRIGVLGSGKGSNFVAIADACAAGNLPAEVALVSVRRSRLRTMAERGNARPLRSFRNAGARRCGKGLLSLRRIASMTAN